jgi:hypothetical protein
VTGNHIYFGNISEILKNFRSVSIYTFGAPKPGSIQVKHVAKHLKIPVKFYNQDESEGLMQDTTNLDAGLSTNTVILPSQTPAKVRTVRMYHDESLLSFFRRPAFSPDGNLLLTPTAQLPICEDSLNNAVADKEEVQFGALLYSRGSLLK